jgi:hypothetical protein
MSDIAEFRKLSRQRVQMLEALAVSVRGLIPVLKDHNLANTVKPIEEALFQIEANDQEGMALVQKDPTAFIEQLLAGLRGQGE